MSHSKAVGRIFLIAGFILTLLQGTPAQAEISQVAEPEGQVEMSQVTGTVSSITQQAISIEYSRTKKNAFEMVLPIDEKTRFERFRTLAELKPGDTVTVRYQQLFKPGEDGGKVILKTTATDVSLVRSAPAQALSSREEASPNE